MIVRVGNSGDFAAVFPMLRQHRLREQELDVALYQLHPDAERRFLCWVGEVGEDPRSTLLVAEEQGRLIGFVYAVVERNLPIYVCEEFAVIREWWVEPPFRGRGVGEALIDLAVAELAAVGESLPVEKIKGRLKVNEYLEMAGHEGVAWAVGDSAAVPDGHGGFHPPTAQHGLRQGLTAATNIEAAVTGAARKPFRFSTIGQLASIGHHTGVAQIFGMRFSGFIAWWLWRSVYLSKLPGFAKKVRVAIQWTLDLLFSRQIEQFLTLKDLEQIEQLATMLRASRMGTSPPVNAISNGAPRNETLARSADMAESVRGPTREAVG
jgi:GNAT superfamily N-acetyltransferase